MNKYNIWLVPTEESYMDKEIVLKEENVNWEGAIEYIWFEHADEPAPDRSDYWNYVAYPVGEIPTVGIKHSKKFTDEQMYSIIPTSIYVACEKEECVKFTDTYVTTTEECPTDLFIFKDASDKTQSYFYFFPHVKSTQWDSYFVPKLMEFFKGYNIKLGFSDNTIWKNPGSKHILTDSK